MSDWTVDNHTFIGKVLVDLEPEVNGMGVKQKPKDGWLQFAIDLRHVNNIKQRKPDDTRAVLYHNGEFVAVVNADFADLLPHFVASRSVFDEPPANNGAIFDDWTNVCGQRNIPCSDT